MLTFLQFQQINETNVKVKHITELFDKQHDISYDGVIHPDPGKTIAIHHYSFQDHKGRKYRARVVHYEGENQANVEFSDHKGEMGVTGGARNAASHAFGAMKQILDHHTKKILSRSENSHITKYNFDSEKEQKPGRWNRYQEGSRNKLYRKFTEKLGGTSNEGTEVNAYTRHSIPVKRD